MCMKIQVVYAVPCSILHSPLSCLFSLFIHASNMKQPWLGSLSLELNVCVYSLLLFSSSKRKSHCHRSWWWWQGLRHGSFPFTFIIAAATDTPSPEQLCSPFLFFVPSSAFQCVKALHVLQCPSLSLSCVCIVYSLFYFFTYMLSSQRKVHS